MHIAELSALTPETSDAATCAPAAAVAGHSQKGDVVTFSHPVFSQYQTKAPHDRWVLHLLYYVPERCCDECNVRW